MHPIPSLAFGRGFFVFRGLRESGQSGKRFEVIPAAVFPELEIYLR
jgi:hypothetical protein